MAVLNPADQLVRLARASSLRFTTAESCTGGLMAAAITEIPGASDIFARGFVTYSNDAKSDMLGVRPATLQRHGAVSEDTAGEMAQGALIAAKADLAIAITGIAGPGGSDRKPEGRVCFALARSGSPILTETKDFTALGRAKVRAAAVQHGLRLLVAAVSG